MPSFQNYGPADEEHRVESSYGQVSASKAMGKCPKWSALCSGSRACPILEADTRLEKDCWHMRAYVFWLRGAGSFIFVIHVGEHRGNKRHVVECLKQP